MRHLALTAALLLALTACAAPAANQVAEGAPPPIPTQQTITGLPSAADGFVGVGDWVGLDDDIPAVTNLDPALRDALARAAAEAAESGVTFSFTDGWRSAAYQQYLFDQAVTTYASEEEARRWVKTPEDSQHVHGLVVDLATADAMDWLSRFGAPYGLCRIYANEMWHFEYVAGVDGETTACPAELPDSSV